MSEGKQEAAGRRIRLGMVGGGQGAFIGAVHRIAARLDDQYEFVAGALSSNPERALTSAAELGLDPNRSYADFESMAAAESARDEGIEAVAIVTPNHVHYPAAKAFLEAGIHVICDKPMTVTSAEGEELVALAEEKQLILAVTYNYTGYPMVRQARAMVANGELGRIRVIQVEYAQDWLSEDLESTGQKQAAWRTDPAQSGAGGAIGDIGTHAYNMACFVSGLETESLCAELTSFVPGRRLDDNAQVMLRFQEGARGLLWASQVAPGNENNLQLRIYGEKGGLKWRQEDPNYLEYAPLGEPPRRITRGGPGSDDNSARVTRIPSGHPEGYLEGFATIYSEVAQAIRAVRMGETVADDVLYPTGREGLTGVRFVEAVVESSRAGSAWVAL
jgi:predicted dehydrogenase